MIVTIVGAVWIAAGIVAAPVVGRALAAADPGSGLLFPPAAPVRSEPGRRGLPARLSPRAGLATSRNWHRFRRELVSHGWLVGLLLACVVGLVYGLTVLQALTPATAIR